METLSIRTADAADVKRRRSATVGKCSTGTVDTSTPSSEFTKVKRMNTFKYVVKQKKHPPVGKALSFSYFQIKDISEYTAANSWSDTKDEILENSLSDDEEVQELTIDISGRGSLSSSSEGETQYIDDLSPLASVRTPTETTPTDTPPMSRLLCSVCSGGLSSLDTIIQYDVGTVHLHCFLCGRCRQPMGAVEEFLVQFDGSPLCHGCTPSCFTCRDKIFHDHISVLKKDFHEQCLACTQCKKVSWCVPKL